MRSIAQTLSFLGLTALGTVSCVSTRPDAANSAPIGSPIIDGAFDDWQTIPAIATDPAGDSTGAFDLSRVQATSAGTVLFLRFDTGSSRNLVAGQASDGTLTLAIENAGNGSRLEFDMRARSCLIVAPPEPAAAPRATRVNHVDVGFCVQPTYAADDFELRVDLTAIGVRRGDSVRLVFGGADALAQPATVVMSGHEPAPRAVGLSRDPRSSLRVANLNVLHRGLTVPERQASIARLLRAADADVYCLQEQWQGTPEEIRAALAAAFSGSDDPRARPESWNVITFDGTALATTLTLETITGGMYRESVGIVTLPTGRRVMMISTHLKCCGYINSNEDRSRINAANKYASFISARRAEDPALGVIIAGDWNLVGSRTPLDILTAPSLGLDEVRVLQSALPIAATWRDPKSDFPPGRLDIMAYSTDHFEPVHAVAFDSLGMPKPMLDAIGVLPDDSAASDHLMIVTDFVDKNSTPR